MLMLSSKTILLPLVSAMKPQKWELETTPRKLIADNTPFSVKDNWRSHCAAGMMNIIPMVSVITLIKHPPAARRRNKLNGPNPKNY